jgi:hypothetical protein
MALYSIRIFRIYTELGISTVLIVCYTLLYTFMCYTGMFSIGLVYCNGGVCLRACSSSMPMGHHGSGSGGAIVVVITVVGMVLMCRRIRNRGHIPRYVGVGVRVVTAPYIPRIPPHEFMVVRIHKYISHGRTGVVLPSVH